MASPGARAPLPDGIFAPYELVCELGARPAGMYVARQPAAPGAKPHLMVAEYFAGLAKGADGKESDFVREARRIATVTSPNLARIRDVAIRGADVVIYGELLDGEKLAELWRPGGLPLEIALRAIVDVLSGVAALHSLRDAKQQPMKLAHGELSPVTIVLGLDGVARVLHAVARRVPGVRPDPGSVGYMAPEVHAGEGYDQRADVFGAGVLLWEVLSGKALFTKTDPAEIAAQVRAGPLPPAGVPVPWAKGLVDVAARALAASPDARWPTAPAMAAELRKAAGLKLAPASTAAAFAKSAIAERSKARRQRLETVPALVPAPAPAAAPAAALEPESIPVHVATLRPAPSPPTEKDMPVAPVIPAPAQEVEELGADALLDAPESIRPQPAPGAGAAAGGFVLDPFAAAARMAPPPAPVLPEPVVQMDGPPVIGAPAFAAAMVAAPVEAPAWPAKEPSSPQPAREPMDTGPSFVRQTDTARRRKMLVLGGVGALGALILVLALARLALRDGRARETPAPAASPAQVVAPVAPPIVSAPPPPASTAALPSSPPAVELPSAAPPAAAAPPPAAPPPPVPQPAAAAKPPPPVAARPAAPPPAPRPKRPKPRFDPNSL